MKLLCKLFGHKYDMYRGYAQIVPHGRAVCVRCGIRYKKEKI